MVFAYCLNVEIDIKAQADATFFSGAAASLETHGANVNPPPLGRWIPDSNPHIYE